MFLAIAVSFMPTQIPLGIFEGILTAIVYQFITSRRPGLIEGIGRQIHGSVISPHQGCVK